MRVASVRSSALLMLLMATPPAAAWDFSLTPASPSVPGRAAAYDILAPLWALPPVPPFPIVIPGPALGFLPGEEHNAFSYGADQKIIPASPTARALVWYSVTPGSVGLAGSVVAAEATGDGAAGDVFELQLPGGALGLQFAAPYLGMIPLPPGPQDDIDGLDHWANLVGPGGFFAIAVYFTVKPPPVPAWPLSGADILVEVAASPAAPAPPVYAVYATAAALGLAPGDEIDGSSGNRVGACRRPCKAA